MLFSNRNSRRSLLIEINPYQILAATIDRPEAGTTTIESAVEFDNGDEAGLRDWLSSHFEKPNAWVPAIAGFIPPEGLLQRESVIPRKLADQGYVNDLVREQCRIENPDAWKIQTLSPLEGELMATEGTQRPALVCGVSHTDVHLMQQRLLDQRLLPQRLEMGILPLLGTISEYQERQNEKRAVVVVVIEQEHTVAYIIGKEGVHTPAPVRHGFSSIVQAARREFELTHAREVRDRLHLADDELLLRSAKFVRAIGRDLKPLVDSYEMTTGQPVGEIFCAYLPAGLTWIAEPLAQVIGRTPFSLDLGAWLSTVGINRAEGVPTLGQHWLGVLSLIAQQPGTAPEKAAKSDAIYLGPWRLDCRISATLPSGDIVRRRFITNAFAVTLAATALGYTVWLAYLNQTYQSELTEWTRRANEKQADVEALNALSRRLGVASDRINAAYSLMAMRYRLTDFVLALGRTRPPNLQIDAIDSVETGVVLRGILYEPSDKARLTLTSYRERLLQDEDIGSAFAAISLTSFTRREQKTGEAFAFELTFKLKPAQP